MSIQYFVSNMKSILIFLIAIVIVYSYVPSNRHSIYKIEKEEDINVAQKEHFSEGLKSNEQPRYKRQDNPTTTGRYHYGGEDQKTTTGRYHYGEQEQKTTTGRYRYRQEPKTTSENFRFKWQEDIETNENYRYKRFPDPRPVHPLIKELEEERQKKLAEGNSKLTVSEWITLFLASICPKNLNH